MKLPALTGLSSLTAVRTARLAGSAHYLNDYRFVDPSR
jgi:hypothetical protein